jgi:hypothetical protein
MADPVKFIDALSGYQYDSFNPDVLLQMNVKNGRVYTPNGTSYAVLVIPGKEPMNPTAKMSTAVANKLIRLAKDGATIILDKTYALIKESKNFIEGPYQENSFEKLGISKDLVIEKNWHRIAWTHRKLDDADIYFLSNQSDVITETKIQFGVHGKIIETASFSDGKINRMFDVRPDYKNMENYNFYLYPHESRFIIFRKPLVSENIDLRRPEDGETIALNNKWKLKIPQHDTVELDRLSSWHLMQDTVFKYYSGTAVYTNDFVVPEGQVKRDFSIAFDSVYNIATVKINGIDCGTLWTAPFKLNISNAIRPGENKIAIEVTNTWRNRLKADEQLKPEQRTTYYNSPYSLSNKAFLPSGIMGSIKLVIK